MARVASHVTTVEINPSHQKQAKLNVEKAGLLNQVHFIAGDILDENLLKSLPQFDAAFLDPDWNDSELRHEYSFVNSNTLPPADALLTRIFDITQNIALVLPPFIDISEFNGLPINEREKLFFCDSHELYCLYFGELIERVGETEFRI